MMEDIQVRNLSLHTKDAYVQQVSQFARHFNRSPEVLGPEEIRSYQVYLRNERKLAPSSIIIAVAALRFLYKITLHKDWSLEEVIPTPQKLPIVLSPEEVLQFLGSVRSIKHRTILTICYAAGLRFWAAIWSSVISAAISATLITPVPIATVPNANRSPGLDGSKIANPSFWIPSTSTWSSPYQNGLQPLPIRTRESSMASCSW